MALTVHQEPQYRWSAVHAPIVFTFTSTQSSQSQFNFVCDVFYWVNGVKTFLGRLRAPAINGVGMFDISGLLASTFNPIPYFGYGFSHCESFYKSYTCDFYEEYDATGFGHPVLDHDTFIEGTWVKNCWGASNNELAYQVGSADMKVLLNHPRDRSHTSSDQIGIQIRMDERCTMMWKRPEIGAIARRLRIRAFKKNGFQVFDYTTPAGDVAMQQHSIWCVGVSPLQINEWALSLGFAFPPINGSVEYYTVQLVTTIGQPASEAVRYNIDRSDSKLHSRRVHWLNKFGGIDSMSFKFSPEYTSERETFVTSRWQFGYTTFSLNHTDPLVQTSTPKTYAEFTSNCLTERGYNSLKGLAISSKIWITVPRKVWKTINQGKPGASLPGAPPIYAQLCDDDYDAINRGDGNLSAGSSWYWIQTRPVPYSQSSGWVNLDSTSTPTTGGYVGMTGVPADSCVYEMDFSLKHLLRIAPISLVWTSPKDNLRQLTFRAELPNEL